MRAEFSQFYVGDFETTVYKDQKSTEVWASALVKLGTEDVEIFHSIDDTWRWILENTKNNVCIYYHNLKFDGQFWLSFIHNKTDLKQCFTIDERGNKDFPKNKDMINNSFKYLISSVGEWYTITVKIQGRIIEFRDSLKLLPFSVNKIGKDFKTKHQKLEMDYVGYRFSGCEITAQEREYIANDVLVVKEALEYLHDQDFKKMTIASCCLHEYTEIFKKGWMQPRKITDKIYEHFYPDLSQVKLDKSVYGSDNVDEYVRKAYKGGWTYVVKGKEQKIYRGGVTADVNSLYPSMMHSQSGNKYPIGLPKFWKGNYIPDQAQEDNKYYFIRIRTMFQIKHNMLPCIQIKNSFFYGSREWLTTSDVWSNQDQKYYRYLRKDGKIVDTSVTLTLTQTDFDLILEHYDLINCEILDGCYFDTDETKMFDRYIDKYKKIKQESKGAQRALAKLCLNSLYGKFATGKDSSYKVSKIDENGVVIFDDVKQDKKKPVYIPVGAAITSYARNFTIRAAQANYYGPDNPGFIYADTDSIHCDLAVDELKGIELDPAEFCKWKAESCWDAGWFVRPKTYIEHITHEDLKQIDEPYYNIKCAGMSEHCKQLFDLSLKDRYDLREWITHHTKEWNALPDEEKMFCMHKRTIKDFKPGLKVMGKLVPMRLPGGVVLVGTTFEMR